MSSYESVSRIRRSHRHARPNPAENPAWANCHMDCGILLAEIEELRAALCGMIDGVRNLEIFRDDWERYIAKPIERAYAAVSDLTAPEINALAESSPESENDD